MKSDIDLIKLKKQLNNCIIGADEAKMKVLMSIKMWKDGQKIKPVCINGPEGVGKERMVIKVAENLGLKIMEVDVNDEDANVWVRTCKCEGFIVTNSNAN